MPQVYFQKLQIPPIVLSIYDLLSVPPGVPSTCGFSEIWDSWIQIVNPFSKREQK